MIATEIQDDRSRRCTNVTCTVCGTLIAWVSDRMKRENPARARALLTAHHENEVECNAASTVVLVCDFHGKITGPILNSRHEIRVCTNRHREAGCSSEIHARPERPGEGR
jgi:hypothetical protein